MKLDATGERQTRTSRRARLEASHGAGTDVEVILDTNVSGSVGTIKFDTPMLH